MLQAAEPSTHFTSHPRHYPGKIKPWELSFPKARLHRTTRAQPSAAPTIFILLLNAPEELITRPGRHNTWAKICCNTCPFGRRRAAENAVAVSNSVLWRVVDS